MDPDTRVYQNHFKYGDQNLFFFSNQSASESMSFTAEINAPGKQVPWIWLPESGKRMLYASRSSDELNIHLHPLESALIVYDEEKEADEYLFVDFSKFNQKKLQIPWKMTFNHMNGDRFVIQKNKLIDFSKAEDERIKTFSGNVLYEGVFTTDATEQVYIDPGDVSGGITTLFINGEKVGTKWFGRHSYYISTWLKPGENNIKIEYVTVLANYALSLKESKAAQRWIQGEPIKQGITGPVTLKYKN
jgi:hypothetical protein